MTDDEIKKRQLKHYMEIYNQFKDVAKETADRETEVQYLGDVLAGALVLTSQHLSTLYTAIEHMTEVLKLIQGEKS